MKKLQCREIIKGLPPILKETDVVSLDLELSGLRDEQLHRPAGRMASLACSFDGETAYIIFEEDEVQEFLGRIEKATFIFHNATFDLAHLRRWAKVEERNNIRDIMIIEKLIYSDYYDDFALNDLVRRYLGCYMPKDVREEFITLETVMTPEQIEYAALDVIGTFLVDLAQQKNPDYDKQDRLIWEKIDLPTVWTAIDLSGFELDRQKWIDLAEDQAKIVERIEENLGKKYGHTVEKVKYAKRLPIAPKVKELYDEGGTFIGVVQPAEDKVEAYKLKMDEYNKSRTVTEEFVPFNPASPAQVLEILKAKGLDVESTGDDEISPFAGNEFVDLILEYRHAAKKVSTYGIPYLKYVESDDRIYPSLNVIGTTTGRNCVSGDTTINTSRGGVEISDIDIAGGVVYTVTTHKGNRKKILEKFYKGKEEMYLVTLVNGSQIKCTMGHRFLTNKGWKCLYEITDENIYTDIDVPDWWKISNPE